MRLLSLVCGAALGLVSNGALAASFVVVNADDPGVGLNDATPVAPVGANTATTLGAQRLAVLDAALAYWAVRLQSAVPIHVQVRYAEGTCTPDSSFVVNGSAINGSVARFDDQDYVVTSAHHNALTGTDLTPGNATETDYDISLRINPLIDTGCAGVAGWWYDTDATVPPPSDRLPFLGALKQELARGLGQWVFGDPDSGTRPVGSNGVELSDAMDMHLLDLEHGRWSQADAWSRSQSARNFPWLVWDGPHVDAAAAGWLDPAPVVVLSGSDGAVFEFSKGTLGPRPHLLGTLAGPVVGVNDGVEPSGDGCQPAVNAAALAGRIALVDRGTCTFAEKAIHAQNAGAIAVLVANNVGGDALPPMGGSDPALVVPALGISGPAGTQLWLAPSPHVSIGYEVSARAATSDGHVRMAADAEPPTYRTITQFAVGATPTVLPQYSYRYASNLDDLSFALLRDIRWPTPATVPNAAPYLDIADTFEAVAGQPSTLTELWFGDIDAGDAALTLRFEVASGTIVLAADTAVQRTGSGTANASITAPRSDLLSYVARGAVRFQSAAGVHADVNLTVTVDDNGHTGSGGSRTAVDAATITLVSNGAPTATGQSVETTMITPRTIDLAGTDPDGDSLAFGIATQPQHGTLAVRLGRVTYTPDAGFSGTDSFQFVALDGVLASAPATVGILVDGQAAQAITKFVSNPANPVLGAGSVTVSATGGGSGNPVTFSIAPASASVCSAGGVHGATITLLSTGTCTVRADQAGSASYLPAPQRTLDIVVADAPDVPRLVRDGGFEAGFDTADWIQGSTNFGSPLCTLAFCGNVVGPRSGQFWAYLGGTFADAESGWVEQSGVIGPDQQTLIFHVQAGTVVGSTPDGSALFDVTIDGDSIFSIDQGNAAAYAGAYTRVSIDVSAYADGDVHTLRFAIDRAADSTLPDIHVDDVGMPGANVFADGFE